MEIWIELNTCRALSALGCGWHNNEKNSSVLFQKEFLTSYIFHFSVPPSQIMFQMFFRPLTYHFHMLEKEMLRMEETGCEIPKLMTDFSASIAQDALHWAMLLVPLLVRLFLNELTFF